MSHKSSTDFSRLESSHEIAAHIAILLQNIRFGSVEIVVHDGRVVQIDKHEKFRIKQQANAGEPATI